MSEEMIWPHEMDAEVVVQSLIDQLASFSPVDPLAAAAWGDSSQMPIGLRLQTRVRHRMLNEEVEGVALTVLAAASIADVCEMYCGQSCGKPLQDLIDSEDSGIQAEAFRIHLILKPYAEKTPLDWKNG